LKKIADTVLQTSGFQLDPTTFFFSKKGDLEKVARDYRGRIATSVRKAFDGSYGTSLSNKEKLEILTKHFQTEVALKKFIKKNVVTRREINESDCTFVSSTLRKYAGNKDSKEPEGGEEEDRIINWNQSEIEENVD